MREHCGAIELRNVQSLRGICEFQENGRRPQGPKAVPNAGKRKVHQVQMDARKM